MLIKHSVLPSPKRLLVLAVALVFAGSLGLEATSGVLAPQPTNYTSNGDLKKRQCKLDNQAFAAGERMVYKLYYNLNFIWIAAGEVEFKVEDYGSQYKLSAIGTTYPSYEWFFKVHDRYESYIDKETLLPSLTIRDVSEGKYTLYERVEYDQKAGTGTGWRGKTRERAMEQPADFDIKSCMHDVLSAIYFMRNLDLASAKPDDEFPVTVMMDRDTYPLDVRYLGREKDKKIKGLGDFDVYELAPEVVAGDVFNEESEMRVWASTAKSHIPLLIESPISVGSVKAVLKEHQNLRHEIAAK